MIYTERTYEVRAEGEDDLVAALWEAGTLGVQVSEGGGGRLKVAAYFAAGSPVPVVPEGAEELAVGELPTSDWLAGYRAWAQPIAMGRRFVADPREPEPGEEVAADGRIVLKLPARTAFGTGGHESTRLAVELIEQVDCSGRRALDVGTGSGVLAFAALALGARSVAAYDFDLEAVFPARDNAFLNRLTPHLFAGTAAALAPRARFELILINVLPEQVLGELAGIAALLAPGGDLIFSGIPAVRTGEVLALADALGLAEAGRAAEGEWIALRLRGARR